MTDSTKLELIQLISNTVLSVPLQDGFVVGDIRELYRLAKTQDMAHLVADALKRNNLVDTADTGDEVWKKFDKEYLKAQYRVISLQADLGDICRTFDEAGIDYIPLKGSVIRTLYPQEWMRVSADIDILVHEEDQRWAENVLEEKLGYKVKIWRSGHHDLVETPKGFFLELHHTLSAVESEAADILHNVWNMTELSTGHQYMMKDEMFYLYHMFHAAKHFSHGGCGVKAVLDTWILNHWAEHDEDARRELLAEGGLGDFARALETVAESWFSEQKYGVMPELENYILDGGVFGGGLRTAVGLSRTGSRTKYILSRAFMDYKSMCILYPVLIRHKILLPFCWALRMIGVVTKGKTGRIRREIRQSGEQKDRTGEISELFEELGIK